MPDPTAAGALSIQITVTDDKGTVITTEQVHPHSGAGHRSDPVH